MIQVASSNEVRKIISDSSTEELMKFIEDGFVLYSQKKVIVPPVGHLSFVNPPGDVHIKFGYIEHDNYYVIKIASGFYHNPTLGLSSSNGLMLIFNQQSGSLECILLDEGYLTDIRTGLAGAVVAKYLAPKEVKAIGIVGTGVQARLQLQFLKSVCRCRSVFVWGRDPAHLKSFCDDPTLGDFNISPTTEFDQITEHCNLIVTTTPSSRPLLFGEKIKPGTHITAVGADTSGKQELDASIFFKAGIIVADSIEQCINHGDISHALKSKAISPSRIIELGNLIHNRQTREREDQITVADLTGVAIQDIQIANYVYLKIRTDIIKK